MGKMEGSARRREREQRDSSRPNRQNRSPDWKLLGAGAAGGDGAPSTGNRFDWLARRGDEATGRALDQKWMEVRTAVGSGLNWRTFSDLVLELTKMLFQAHR